VRRDGDQSNGCKEKFHGASFRYRQGGLGKILQIHCRAPDDSVDHAGMIRWRRYADCIWRGVRPEHARFDFVAMPCQGFRTSQGKNL
jgi:hypothetical protein